MKIIFPERVYGIETEYGCMLQKNGIVVPLDRWPQQFLQKHYAYHVNRFSCIFTVLGEFWDTRGSRTYVDRNHPEHSTPEARSVRDAVIYSRAGDMRMRELFRHPTSGIKALLFKNNCARQNNFGQLSSFACHENYFAPGDRTPYDNPSFLPFLMTRQILDGSGSWSDTDAFFLSQRARALGRPINQGGCYHILAPGFKPKRLHLQYGDSNMLDVAAFLKLGTTSLLLPFLESRFISPIECANSLKDYGQVSARGAAEPVIYITSFNRKMSALDIQFFYLDFIRRHISSIVFASDEIEAESLMILQLWERALNAIAANDTDWMFGRIDWMTKKMLYERAVARAQASSKTENIDALRATIDLMYHSIMDECMRDRIFACKPECCLAFDAEMEHAMHCPPKGTRAQVRGALIKKILEMHPWQNLKIGWDMMVWDQAKDFRRYVMQDPFDAAIPDDLEHAVKYFL